MSDLKTDYLGLTLENPLVVAASPLGENLDLVRAAEDAGAAAIVLPSLFEEQLDLESRGLHFYLEHGSESYAEAARYLPEMRDYNTGPEGYLDMIRRAKQAVGIPVLASLNGSTPGGWIRYARLMEQAGADAIELNVYDLPTDPTRNAAAVEQDLLTLVRSVVEQTSGPISVKLSPQFTAPVALARELASAGARGLVLFNRFYQPDFDLESLDVVPRLVFSQPHELLLRLHWTAILYGRVAADLAITGGVHSATDVVKSMMAGANVAMLASVLLERGIDHLRRIRRELEHWLAEHEYESILQMRGSLSLQHVDDPRTYERGNYMKVLRSYRVREL